MYFVVLHSELSPPPLIVSVFTFTPTSHRHSSFWIINYNLLYIYAFVNLISGYRNRRYFYAVNTAKSISIPYISLSAIVV